MDEKEKELREKLIGPIKPITMVICNAIYPCKKRKDGKCTLEVLTIGHLLNRFPPTPECLPFYIYNDDKPFTV